MIEITSYKCSYCGKVFENEDECIAHEAEERLASVRLNGDLECWDFVGNKLALDDCFNVEEVGFVVARSDKARELFDELQEMSGCPLCYVDDNYKCNTLMYYDCSCDEWRNWQKEIDTLYSVRNKLKDYFKRG